jgi:hypothetical protein
MDGWHHKECTMSFLLNSSNFKIRKYTFKECFSAFFGTLLPKSYKFWNFNVINNSLNFEYQQCFQSLCSFNVFRNVITKLHLVRNTTWTYFLVFFGGYNFLYCKLILDLPPKHQNNFFLSFGLIWHMIFL